MSKSNNPARWYAAKCRAEFDRRLSMMTDSIRDDISNQDTSWEDFLPTLTDRDALVNLIENTLTMSDTGELALLGEDNDDYTEMPS